MDEYIKLSDAISLIEEKQKELCPLGQFSRNATYGSDREAFDRWQEIIDELKQVSKDLIIEFLDNKNDRFIENISHVTVERDAAIDDLRGKCSVCVHYTANHHKGVCAHCRWDYTTNILPSGDFWQWRGPQKEDEKNAERIVAENLIEAEYTNREILFRGKRLDNGEWVKGGYWLNDTVTRRTPHIIDADGESYAVDFSTISQYTGLLDKNGVKIFEGDILDCQDRIVYVRWNDKCAQWDSEFIRYQGELCSNGIIPAEWEYRSVVIGNIYDNGYWKYLQHNGWLD